MNSKDYIEPSWCDTHAVAKADCGCRGLLRHPSVPPVDETVFHGIIGDLTAVVAPNTEADPLALTVNLLAWAGCRIGPGVHVEVGSEKHPPLLWPMLIGGTSTGRKGTADAETITAISAISALPRRRSGLSSGEGLIQAFLPGEDDLPVDPRLIVVESEFEQVMSRARRESSTLSPVLRDFWDARPVGTITINSREVELHHLVVIGHITPQGLRASVSALDIGNGFLNRFLPLLVARSQPIALPKPHGTEVQRLRQQVVDRAGGNVRNGPWTFTQAAETAYASWYMPWTDESHDHSERIQQATARLPAHLLRAALIFAVMDDPRSGRIDVAHIQAAKSLVTYADMSARVLYAPGTVGPEARILSSLNGEWVAREDIRRLVRLPSSELTLLLDQMASSGLLEMRLVADGLPGRNRTEYRRGGKAVMAGKETAP